MYFHAQSDLVQNIFSTSIGCLRTFNPSHPKPVYHLNMASEEDRRLATILISLSNAFQKNTSTLISKSDVTTGRTFGNDTSKNEDEDEDKSNKIEGDNKLVGRWRVVSVEMEQRRVEMIEKEIQEGEDGGGESKEEMVEEEKKKEEKKKKKKETKKNTNNKAEVEIPKTKVVYSYVPLDMTNLSLPNEGLVRITTAMNVLDHVQVRDERWLHFCIVSALLIFFFFHLSDHFF
jgi:hypothetical protein